MKLKIQIRTPKGQAAKTEKRITPYIIGCKKKDISVDSYISKEDNEIVWEIEGPIRRLMKISRNASRFDYVIRSMLDSKAVKKTIRKHLDGAQEDELQDMLLNHTTCEVIKEATAEEIVESQKTWWQRVKENFTKKKLV